MEQILFFKKMNLKNEICSMKNFFSFFNCEIFEYSIISCLAEEAIPLDRLIEFCSNLNSVQNQGDVCKHRIRASFSLLSIHFRLILKVMKKNQNLYFFIAHTDAWEVRELK